MYKGSLFINKHVLPTYLAISAREQQQGLKNIPWKPPILSFIYKEAQINRFWMQDTPSPLNIVFCCKDRIVQICEGKPLSTAIIGGNNYSDLVVEFPYGAVDELNMKVGDEIGLVHPTKAQLNKIIFEKYGGVFSY